MYTFYYTGITFISLLAAGSSFLSDDQLATEPHFTVTETSTPQVTTTATAAPYSCSDRLTNCDGYLSSCLTTGHLLKWAKYNCAKTCSLCDGSPSQTGGGGNEECKDKVSCHTYESATCTNPQYKEWVFENCRSFCGLCEHCAYNGVVYKRGESWQDGCSYNCTCLGQGNFNCTPRCETFQKVPPNCHYITSTVDSCCQDIVCRVDTPRGPIMAPYKNGNICRDKLSNCGSFPESCAPEYEDWARENCPLTCNRC